VVSRYKIVKLITLGLIALSFGFSGCTTKPNNDDLTKLEEARSAAESAEQKLAELKKERMQLESELQKKETKLP
jgi:septal ring factor EnvC (AmiA/AmiB activator)